MKGVVVIRRSDGAPAKTGRFTRPLRRHACGDGAPEVVDVLEHLGFLPAAPEFQLRIRLAGQPQD